MRQAFDSPPESAKPWTIWYWLKGAVSEEGISADLDAMEEVGLGGAYLMPLISPDEKPFWAPPIDTLSEEYWSLVRYAMSEARSRDLKLGLHIGPGFSLAGGPWITPELSMQRVVWSETHVTGGQALSLKLQQPEAVEGYYRDIATFAVRSAGDPLKGAELFEPQVVTNSGEAVSRLSKADNDEPLRMKESGWIEYSYPEIVTVRSVRIRPHGNSYQALRLRLEASVDGEVFELVKQFVPPRHGWQDGGQSIGQSLTYSIPETRARVFRFVFDPAGSEAGAEDLDWAKWKPIMKVKRIQLSSIPRLEQFEGKSAAVWRVADWSEVKNASAESFVAAEDVIDLSDKVDADGMLLWSAPEGEWMLLRMGHTCTGATNYTGGAAEGLEADKLNPEAIALQFDSWFAETSRRVGPELFSDVVEVLHSDSWEAESQNWSVTLRDEFVRRRGYDPVRFLAVMAGVVIDSADSSERFLYDLRLTISELVNDAYFGTLSDLAHSYGCAFSSESVSPTMVSDNLRHHGTVDLPMGEFWLNSPTHDKPMDMRDAVSGAHIYGKQIVQAEAFTQLRIAWDEAPRNLKAWGDAHFALGVNRFVFHVFMQTPWVDREPGVTLNGVGLFFQRGQTWWKQAKAWVDYLTRSQALLQLGKPVTDIAVFAGEERPSRALQPDRLAGILPGLLGEERIESERRRLENEGIPMQERPKGVKSTKNATDLSHWNDPLNGYAYDSVNLDVLLDGAQVREKRLQLRSGADYGVLVIPGKRRMNPEGGGRMSSALAAQLVRFATSGLPIVIEELPRSPLSMKDSREKLTAEVEALKSLPNVFVGPWQDATLGAIGIAPDIIFDVTGKSAESPIAWIHRRLEKEEFYFLSNQNPDTQAFSVSLRVADLVPELWNPVTGKAIAVSDARSDGGRLELSLTLAPYESVFLVLSPKSEKESTTPLRYEALALDGSWQLRFPNQDEAIVLAVGLASWPELENAEAKGYSGTASYSYQLTVDQETAARAVRLDLGEVADIAEVFLNGKSLGVVWTAPWQADLTGHLRAGSNELRIEVTNTWANALMTDHAREDEEKLLWTNAPYRLEGESLLKAGLLGPVRLLVETEEKSF